MSWVLLYLFIYFDTNEKIHCKPQRNTVNTREGNMGKPSTKLTNEAHMGPVIVGSNNSTRPKTMSSPTFIKTFKVLPLVKWGKSDGFQAPVPDLLAIVDQGFPNNFLSFRVMLPILVEAMSFHSIQTVQRIIPLSKDQISCTFWNHRRVLVATTQCFQWSEGDEISGMIT